MGEVTEEKSTAAQPEIASVPAIPCDAVIHSLEDKQKMQLTIKVDAPKNGGGDVTLEKLTKHLRDKKIAYGIDEEMLLKIAGEPLYDQLVTVAVGTPAQDGIDGKVTEKFAREVKPTFKERDDGTVDFKELNLVLNVDEGAVICEIQVPTKSVDGRNIYGATIRGRNGLAAVIPQGENTKLSEDGTLLCATTAGSLVFRKGKFCVDPVLKLENVDTSSGNIRFNGDVVVRGNVQEGFEIRCKGNVRVDGMVEGASIFADGSILLTNGINGMNHGILEAGKELTAKYIENCTVRAGGGIKAETIVNSTVETDGGIEIRGKRGRIAGGKLTVLGSIDSRRIGSRSAVQTTIVLGTTPSLMKEKAALEQELKAMTPQLEEMSKNLAYLERLESLGQMDDPERRRALNQIRLQLPVLKMKKGKLQKQKEDMEARIQGVGASMLVSQKVYPPTKIIIGNASKITNDIIENCRIFRDSTGEIMVGKTV